MDVESATASEELSYRDFFYQNNHGLGISDLDRPPGCGLCGRSMSLEGEVNRVHQNDSVCDDCKFLLIEDFGTPARNWTRRRSSRRSRSIYGGSDSTENLFSANFSPRRVEPAHEEVLINNDTNSRLLQPSSSHATPNESRRWRGITSETESDFPNSDSYYGESESNISSAYYNGESDALSFGTYDDDSDSSVGGRRFFNTDILQSIDRSDLDSDYDIDPMHAGNVHWDFEDSLWEEVDNEANTVEPMNGRPHIDASEGNGSSESLAIISRRIREDGLQIRRSPYIGYRGNYLDSRGFEEFLERIEEANSSRRGAPPASTSFVNDLPIVTICEENQKTGELSCAICKDLLTSGTLVNQLPCLHLYHPNCILPWLSKRNTCPLCRYELPITDLDRQDDSSITTDSTDMDELRGVLEDVGPIVDISSSSRRRRGWFLFAAAPIVSLMGIVFVFWLGNPLSGRGRGQFSFHCQPPDRIETSSSCPGNERDRRWWRWF